MHAALEARCVQDTEDHARIKAELESALKERERLMDEHRTLQRSYTPRPHWDKIMDMCPELRRRVHERTFDAITAASKPRNRGQRSHAGSDQHTEPAARQTMVQPQALLHTAAATKTTPTTGKGGILTISGEEGNADCIMGSSGGGSTPAGAIATSIGGAESRSAFSVVGANHLRQRGGVDALGLLQTEAGATSTADRSSAAAPASTPDENVRNSTKQLTLDLCELLEGNRRGHKETMELEGTLRELGVVDLKKILQDTKRHIAETDKMIEDLQRTQQSIEQSSTHKALVGGDRHTILEGQFFTGVGNHPQVPRHLRWSGKVRKRGIQKGELWALTDKVWKARIKQRQQWSEYRASLNAPASSSSSSSSSSRVSFSSISGSTKAVAGPLGGPAPPEKPEATFAEFFYNFLFRLHKSHQLVVEWGYNVMAGLEVYMWDAHLELFLLCLTGAVTEDTFDDQLILLNDLRAFFLKIDLADAKRRQLWQPSGIVQLDDAVASLREFFPDKKPTFWAQIVEALSDAVDPRIQGPGSKSGLFKAIEYEKLFSVSNLGTQGDFLEEGRDQHLREVRESAIRLEVEVAKHVVVSAASSFADGGKGGEAGGSGGGGGGNASGASSGTQGASGSNQGEIMVMALRDILKKIDPSAPDQVIDNYLATGLECKVKDIRWDHHVDPDLFLRRMRMRLYRPHRAWVKRARPKLVYWRKQRAAELAELRAQAGKN